IERSVSGRTSAISALPTRALAIGRSALTTWLLLSGTSSDPAWSAEALDRTPAAFAGSSGAAHRISARTMPLLQLAATLHLIITRLAAAEHSHLRADRTFSHRRQPRPSRPCAHR